MRRKPLISLLLISTILCLFSISVYAHPGKTDSYGGHHNHSTGSHHYHHGYPAHQHTNGVCPYEFDDQTNHNSGSGGNVEKNESTNNPPSTSTNNSSNKTRKWLTIYSLISSVLCLVYLSMPDDFKKDKNEDKTKFELSKFFSIMMMCVAGVVIFSFLFASLYSVVLIFFKNNQSTVCHIIANSINTFYIIMIIKNVLKKVNPVIIKDIIAILSLFGPILFIIIGGTIWGNDGFEGTFMDKLFPALFFGFLAAFIVVIIVVQFFEMRPIVWIIGIVVLIATVIVYMLDFTSILTVEMIGLVSLLFLVGIFNWITGRR